MVTEVRPSHVENQTQPSFIRVPQSSQDIRYVLSMRLAEVGLPVSFTFSKREDKSGHTMLNVRFGEPGVAKMFHTINDGSDLQRMRELIRRNPNSPNISKWIRTGIPDEPSYYHPSEIVQGAKGVNELVHYEQPPLPLFSDTLQTAA